MQHVQELPLIFVNALHLDIEQGCGVHGQPQSHVDDIGQPLLVHALKSPELATEDGIVGKRTQVREVRKVAEPFFADARGN